MNTNENNQELKAQKIEDINTEHNKLANIIAKLACRFRRKYGGTLDEWISEINMIFIIAYKTYNDSKGASLSSWLYTLSTKRMLNLIKKEAQRYNKVKLVGEAIDLVESKQTTRLKHSDFLSKDAMELLAVMNAEAKNILDEVNHRRTTTNYDRKTIAKRILLERLRNKDHSWNYFKLDKCLNEINELVYE